VNKIPFTSQAARPWRLILTYAPVLKESSSLAEVDGLAHQREGNGFFEPFSARHGPMRSMPAVGNVAGRIRRNSSGVQAEDEDATRQFVSSAKTISSSTAGSRGSWKFALETRAVPQVGFSGLMRVLRRCRRSGNRLVAAKTVLDLFATAGSLRLAHGTRAHYKARCRTRCPSM